MKEVTGISFEEYNELLDIKNNFDEKVRQIERSVPEEKEKEILCLKDEIVRKNEKIFRLEMIVNPGS